MMKLLVCLAIIVTEIQHCAAFQCQPMASPLVALKGSSTSRNLPSCVHRVNIMGAITTSKCIPSSNISQLSLSRKDDDQDSDDKKNKSDKNNNNPYQEGQQQGSKLTTDCFLSLTIDDPGLPVADTLLAQIVAPSLQVFWLSLNRAPLPTWLTLASTNGQLYAQPTQGAFLAPSLIHGAGLAVCWIAGALAARSFESDAYTVSGGKGYGEVVKRTLQAGSFATGLLIFGTQIDLLFEFGRFVQLGEDELVDFRLLQASVEVLNDIVFEAAVLGSWRLYRASLTAELDNLP